jgi:sulfate adenylyltransferase
MIRPYGNKLINQVISYKDLKNIKVINNKKKIIINEDDYINLINLSLGFYSPLNGYCNYKTFNSIINYKKYKKKISWTIPILLHYLRNEKKFIKNTFYKLVYKKKVRGVILFDEIFKINKNSFCKNVFGTTSSLHIGVNKFKKKGDYCIGGKVFLLKNFIPKNKYFKNPVEFRNLIKKKNANSTAAFTTRNICHVGHSFLHSYILKKNKVLYITIINGTANKYNLKTIFETYKIIIKKSKLQKKVKILSINMPTLFAGPKETFLQATMIQNLGINKFLVGRDHAGIKSFYKKYESQNIFFTMKNLSIKIIKTKEPKMCSYCKRISFENILNICIYCNKNTLRNSINGKDIKKNILKNNYQKLENYLDSNLISFFKRKRFSI